jgi:hypothetical protein
MIQFKRGKTSTWEKQKTVLADGQPGYDKERNKLKIGNGKDSWKDLPDASGLFMDEIIDSEENAKNKAKAKAALNPLANFVAGLLKKENRTVITYGAETPDKNTIGQVYLQHYETEPETDYVVEYGTDRGWYYKKWRSGLAECYGNLIYNTDIQMPYDNKAYHSAPSRRHTYPIKFVGVPYETATLHSPGPIVWLASRGKNTEQNTGEYCLLSFDNQTSAEYSITIKVHGYWK